MNVGDWVKWQDDNENWHDGRIVAVVLDCAGRHANEYAIAETSTPETLGRVLFVHHERVTVL